jgi:S1-C subfamily serine protease
VADSPAGPVFDRVLRPSAAAGAGIEVGDRLVAFDGRPTPGANAFANLLGVYPAGWPVSVAYRRGETEMRRELVLDPLPIRGKISWPKADPMWVRAVAAGAATMPAPVALATMPAGTGAGEAPAVESFRDVVPAILPGLVKIHGGSIAREAGYASGVLVSAEGEVVTALSVLLDAADLRVITADGDVHTATVKYRDEYRQLALLSIQDLGVAGEGTVRGRATGHRPVVLDEGASPQAGDTILVAGNPFKIAGGDEPCSVTRGILSGRIRLDARRAGGGPGVAYHGEVLIMDAMASNVGSAGSAVFDGQGRWIGLVGEVVESRLTNTLLNYAFTAREVADFLRDARAGGATPARPVDVAASLAGYHGIRLSRLAYRQRLPFVESVVRDSPAARAGVQAGDLVVSVNGAAIPRSQAFDEVCGRLHPGDEMSIIVKRGNALKTLRVTLAEVPK